MAPPSSTRTDVTGVPMQEDKAKEILMTFLGVLAISLDNVDTYKVNF